MGFSTPSYDLIDLFNRVDRGDLQLPDFQRSFRWDADRIRNLLVTVLRGYPMGAIMALDTRNETPRFKARALEGAPDTGEDPGLLLLDGQQRLTTLYQCFRGDGIVDTLDFRKKKVRRTFFVDVKKATSEEVLPDESVVRVTADGRMRSHFGPKIEGNLNDREVQLKYGLLPIASLLNDKGTELLFDMAESGDPELREAAKQFNNTVLKPLVRYAVPMIRLDRETAQEGIGSIFAQANVHGLEMDVYELLTAIFQLEDPDFSLKDDWNKTELVLRKYPALDGIGKTEFLTAVALYASAKNGKANGHREAILQLDLAEYKRAAGIMRAAFNEAADFMAQRMILTTSQVPYTDQLIPLAVIIALLAETPGVLTQRAAWSRLDRWFWSGVFGELYGSPSANIRAASDVNEVTPWVKDVTVEHSDESEQVPTPGTVEEARFVESRLLSAGPKSGLYKGIYALLLGRGAIDWRTATKFDRESFPQLGVHFRQIFPAAWCEEHGIPEVVADSVLNRTPMSRRTHVLVENSSPARYLYRLQSKSLLDDDEFDAVLASHLIEPHLLLSARAEEFFLDRRQKYVSMIEEAMGNAAVRDMDESDLIGGEEGPEAFALEPSDKADVKPKRKKSYIVPEPEL